MAYRETVRVKERKAAQQLALLRAAEALVREHGFAGLTIQALATGAGVGVGTVYRYYRAKDELAAEVFRLATEREVAAVAAAISGDGTAAQRLAAAVGVFARRAMQAPRLAWALIAEPADPAVDAVRLTYRQAYADVFEVFVEDAILGQELPQQNAKVVAAALVGAMAEALVGPLAGTLVAHQPDDQVIEQLQSFCARAIGLGANSTVVEADKIRGPNNE
jgi:AcrR family transcriptional regulator